MVNRPAYLAPPGLSFTTIFLNLSHIMTQSEGAPPIILVDIHDYDQLRGAVMEGGSGNEKAPYLLTACDNLRRRDVIRLIDYADFYPAEKQANYLRQNRELLQAASDNVNQQVAATGDDEWISYARGEYQESPRARLGEDVSSFDKYRRAEEKQHRKMKRGLGDPVEWNEKVMGKGVAALKISDEMDNNTNLNVRGVIASTQYHTIGELLEATKSDRDNDPAIEGLNLGADRIDVDATYLNELNPTHRIEGLGPEKVTPMNDILEHIGEISTNVAGVQYNDWGVLGPIFTVPQSEDIFNIRRVRRGFERNDVDDLAERAEAVINALETVTEDVLPATKAQYEAEWAVEQSDLSRSSRPPIRELTETVYQAVESAQYSPELRSVVGRDMESQAAGFIAASVMNDPKRQYDNNSVYRRAIRLVNLLDPPPVSGGELDEIEQERRGDKWTDRDDWYQVSVDDGTLIHDFRRPRTSSRGVPTTQ
jgi:hypothetical protein